MMMLRFRVLSVLMIVAGIVALVLNLAVSINVDLPIGEIFFKYVPPSSHHVRRMNSCVVCCVLCVVYHASAFVAGLLPLSLPW